MQKYFLILFMLLTTYADTMPPFKLKHTKRKCNNNDYVACYQLGYDYDQREDSSNAGRYYIKSCDIGYGKACSKVAEMYLVGDGVGQNETKFYQYMTKACSLGYKSSCQHKIKPTKKPKMQLKTKTKKTNKLIINNTRMKNIGKLSVHNIKVNKNEHTIELTISMTNTYQESSGWLSLSFPQIANNIVISHQLDGFKHIKSFPKDTNIYNTQLKKSISSEYLLVEADTQIWEIGETKQYTIKLQVPQNIEKLRVLSRGTLKHNKTVKSLPKKGTIGQQGFYNNDITIPIGKVKNKDIRQTEHTSTQSPKKLKGKNHITISDSINTISNNIIGVLNREDKLILIDKLLDFSYFHRDREAFEKQLQETLFGGAKYTTYIQKYQCIQKRAGISQCILILNGSAVKNSQQITWSFKVNFDAINTENGPKITEMISLELLQ